MSDDWLEARPKGPVKHEIGEDLYRQSVHELRERIEMLGQEARRLEAEIERKTASAAAAESVFSARDER